MLFYSYNFTCKHTGFRLLLNGKISPYNIYDKSRVF